MLWFIVRRLLISVLVVLGILTLNFVLIHAAPGSPADLLLNPEFDDDYNERLAEAYGLNDPVWEQYLKYLDNVLLHFDLGHSIQKQAPVGDLILEALPNTLLLTVLAVLVALAVGVALGIFSAVKQYSLFDHAARLGSLVVYSTPSFCLGLLLIFLFAGGVSWLRILPPSGIENVIPVGEAGSLERLWDRLRHLVLPVLTLGIGGAAGFSRYMRGEMLEVIRQDYMRTARAKGLGEGAVVFKHGLRNALLPMVTLLGLTLPFLFSGSVIVEGVFGWPGMGRLAVDAAFGRDYPMLLAVNLLFAALVVLGNLITDVLYAVVDPRIRLR
ncbi:MAG: ABC transporter permease [Planctomycetota bacterium]|nr:ABC transporter permease [Planctomycetota bacterium]